MAQSSLEESFTAEQRKLIATKFEQRLSVMLNQSIELSTQLEHLKIIMHQNQNQLNRQNISLLELKQRIEQIQNRTEAKLTSMNKQLTDFRGYYDHTYRYTVTRINEVNQAVAKFAQVVNEQINKMMGNSAVDFVKYAYQLVVSVVKNSATKTQEIKYYVNQQLYELELQVGKFKEYAIQIQQIVNEYKIIKFGNQSLRDSIQQNAKMIQRIGRSENTMSDSQMGRKVVSFFEPKFKQILKRVNGYSIEIQMVRLMINTSSNQVASELQLKEKEKEKQRLQLSAMQSKIKELQAQIEEQRKQSEKQATKKEDVLKKRHERILQLQDTLSRVTVQKSEIQKTLNELRKDNAQLAKLVKQARQTRQMKQVRTKKVQKDSGMITFCQIDEDDSENEKFLELESKLKILQLEYQNLLKKYYSQEAELNTLKKNMKKREGELQSKLTTSQKLLKFDQNILPERQREGSVAKSKRSVPKYSTFTADTISKSWVKNTKNEDINQFQLQQNEKLLKQNRQLRKINKQFEDQIHRLILDRQKQNQEDQIYLDQVEAQSEKYAREIQRLQIVNTNLTKNYKALQVENERLEEKNILEFQIYQTKQKNFKNLINQLQKKIQTFSFKSQQLALQNSDRVSSYDPVEAKKSFQGSPSLKSGGLASSGHSSSNMGEFLDQNAKPIRIRQRKSRKSSNFLLQLQSMMYANVDAIISTGLQVPIQCEFDKNGYIRQQKTGNYLVDENKNPMVLSEDELQAALDCGLILI